MALICPRLYFFMAHQCGTRCPSSIGKGHGFGFLPPRETTIRLQQAREVPGITTDKVLSISRLKSNPRVKSYTAPYHSYSKCEKKNKQTKKLYYSWKLCLVCILHPFQVALTFVSTRLIWGSPLSPDQFDV